MTTSTPRGLTTRLHEPAYAELVLAVVFVWGTGDLLSTFAAVHFAGVGGEANPLIRTLLLREPLLVVALKSAVVLFVGLVLLRYQSVVERVPRWRLWLAAIIGLGTGIVAMNLTVASLAATI
jgi:hypothetical protein